MLSAETPQAQGRLQILEKDRLLTEDEIANLTEEERHGGVDPAKYGGRHFLPCDQVRPEDEVTCAAVIRNPDYYFREGITFSDGDLLPYLPPQCGQRFRSEGIGCHPQNRHRPGCTPGSPLLDVGPVCL